MATFRFVGRDINIHWNGYDIVGPAGTVFSIPDQLYEEFESDLRGAEPTLEWIDTNEFLTLTNAVSVTTLQGTFPISVTTTTSGKIIGVTSSSAADGYVLTSDGSGGVAWEALPADATGITNIIGSSPISAQVTGSSATISLTANYQTAGTYVTSVVGTSPLSASGSTAITVTLDQALITAAASAINSETLRHMVKNTTGTTIPKGSAVYVSGATGDNALIALSTASTEVGSSKTLGVTSESIANDAFGYVVESGYLTGIDTSGVTAGTPIWLGTTPGSLVYGSPPAEPNHSVYLGVVIREQQNNGSILVKVQNGYELDELHDVSVGSPTDLDILQYKNSSGLWTKSSIANAGIASSVHTHDYQPSGNYQTAGTYVNAVVGTSPASVSTASGTSTVSIISSSINSSHLADNAVVASKIAASAVGVVAISSGTSANGSVLTANGSGGASFNPLSVAALEINAATYTVINGAMVTAAYNTSAAKTADTVSAALALDDSSDRVFQITDRREIKSFSAIDGSAISSATITAVVAAEQLQDIAYGGGALIVISNQTATGGASKYYIIDPSALTVKNSGNLLPAGQTITTQGEPKVMYDGLLGDFVIFGAYGTTATSVQTGGYVRTIDPSTYSTRVTQNAAWETVWGDGVRSFPVWISVNSANRWAFGQNAQVIDFYSDSGADTQFMTSTGSADFGADTTTPQLFIDPSDSTNLLLTFQSETSGKLQSTAYHIKFSEISSAYNSSNVSLSSLLTTAKSFTLSYAQSPRGTDVIFKTVNGRQWLLVPVSGINHIYASTRTSTVSSQVASDFLTASPWGDVATSSNPHGDRWSMYWTSAADIGYDGTEWYVIHASSNSTFHGAVKQKVRAVQTINIHGTSVTSPSIVSPGSFGLSNNLPIYNPSTNPSNILATFVTTAGDVPTNELYLVNSGSTWTWDVYPGLSATGQNTIVEMPGRMIIRS